MTTTTLNSKPGRANTPRRRWAFAAMVAGAMGGLVSMAWACTANMGDATMSPTSVSRNTTFKFWGQGLTPKTGYKLYLVDAVQMMAGLECHSTSTVFTTKYKKYDANGNVVTKTGMRTNGAGVLDADLTLSAIQPYKAYLPSVYPEDSVAAGPHDYRPGFYPDPGNSMPTGRATVCAKEVDANGKLTDYTATEHLPFTIT